MEKKGNGVLLELRGLSKHFGGLAAVEKVDLGVERGQIMGLIGPNGEGKATLFNLVSGVLKPTSGVVVFGGEEITALKPSEIAKKGLVRTFQGMVLFKDFTVVENVLLGLHLHAGIGFWADVVNTGATKRRRGELLDRAMEIVRFMGLEGYQGELAKNLPHGHQRALGVGIALASDPKFMMLDEPTSGMNMEEKETIMGLVGRIKDRGVTLLVVEHDMKVVMGLCDRIAVLNFGLKIAEGTPEEIRSNKDVIEAYLGAEDK